MPTVDINTPSQVSSASKGGFGTGLPLPVLLGIVGGGIGLVVFLTRKSGANQQTDTNASNGTLLPNTAIMLGSLQQMLLETEGKVTSGNADLSSQLTGVGENLGLQIDTQSGQIQGSFDAMAKLIQDSTASLFGEQESLATTVSNLGSNDASAFQGIHDQLTGSFVDVNNKINNLTTVQNINASQIDALGKSVTAQLSNTQRQVIASQYQNYAIATSLIAGKDDPRVNAWLQAAQNLMNSGTANV